MRRALVVVAGAFIAGALRDRQEEVPRRHSGPPSSPSPSPGPRGRAVGRWFQGADRQASGIKGGGRSGPSVLTIFGPYPHVGSDTTSPGRGAWDALVGLGRRRRHHLDPVGFWPARVAQR